MQRKEMTVATTANKAMWVRAAWDGAFSHGKPQDIMVGVDGDNVIIWRLDSDEKIRIKREDWAKLFWMVKNQIEKGEQEEEAQAQDGEVS